MSSLRCQQDHSAPTIARRLGTVSLSYQYLGQLSESVRRRLSFADLWSLTGTVPLFTVTVTDFPSFQTYVLESHILDSGAGFYHRGGELFVRAVFRTKE